MEYEVAYTVPARPFVSRSARKELLLFLVLLTTLHKATLYLPMLIYHSLFICCIMYLLYALVEIFKQRSYYWQQNGETEKMGQLFVDFCEFIPVD
jgi:hypothetical protein